ncbi:cation diffusion facilitator family transporter [Patescibacteria group bacterium]|nr:cation diffusion facilitator family transporter [Patescibacteria group bacterium]
MQSSTVTLHAKGARADHHNPSQLETRFIKSLILNAGLAIGEIAMSIITGSTALLADGLNNIDDVAALLLSIFSERKAQQGPTERNTFGYKRMDAIAGFAKGFFLLASAFFVLIQAMHFILTPQVIDGITVMAIGGIALIVNLLSAFWLKGDSCHSLNARGTYYCMVYDAFGSLSVIISGLLSMTFNFLYFDVIASLFIAFLMVKAGWNILRECIELFMQSAPAHFSLFRSKNEHELNHLGNI